MRTATIWAEARIDSWTLYAALKRRSSTALDAPCGSRFQPSLVHAIGQPVGFSRGASD